MKNVLITGGAGFVGTNLRNRLRKDASISRICLLDRAYQSTTAWEKGSNSEVEATVDVRDANHLAFYAKGCDTIIHLAANSDISTGLNDPSFEFFNSTTCTQSVLEAARVCGVSTVIFPSGSGVYGDCGDRYVHEDSVVKPVSPYGASKLSSEAMMAAYSYMFGIRSIVLRIANIVGPHQTHGVGYDFINRLKQNPNELKILGDGNQSKSYISIEDVVSAMLHLDKTQNKLFDLWNCANDSYLTVKEIAAMACETLGVSPEFQFTGGYGGWKGDVPVIRFDTRKILSTGWIPLHDSRQSMKIALDSMK